MFHFLAKLGQNVWAKQVAVVIVTAAPGAYLGVHAYGLQSIRNFLIAEDDDGKKAEISDRLQSLILTVNEEIKDVFNQSMMPEAFKQGSFATPPKPIKWFCSCTLMPITFGSTLSSKGVLIGLPNYMNYDKAEDLPESMFFLKKVKLFKEKKSNKNDENSENNESSTPPSPPQLSPGQNNQPATEVLKLDRNDPIVQNYTSTLILSDKAKKFVVARELFFADSWRVLEIAGFITISGLMALSLSRAGVRVFRLADAHVSQRIPVYGLSTFAGIVNYYLTTDATNKAAAVEADKRAATINEEYMEGAKEFFEKTIERNKALRELLDDFKSMYDERGNLKQPMVRSNHLTLSERLKLIRRENTVVRN